MLLLNSKNVNSKTMKHSPSKQRRQRSEFSAKKRRIMTDWNQFEASSILHHRNRHEKESITPQSEAKWKWGYCSWRSEFWFQMCSWRSEFWQKAIKSRFFVAYIFLLNPDYVAAHSLRSFRSNKDWMYWGILLLRALKIIKRISCFRLQLNE